MSYPAKFKKCGLLSPTIGNFRGLPLFWGMISAQINRVVVFGENHGMFEIVNFRLRGLVEVNFYC